MELCIRSKIVSLITQIGHTSHKMAYITNAHQAELNAAKIMREQLGYIDAHATTGGSDGGIDVRSRRAYAQVKWRGGLAGRPDLQKLVGSRGRETDKALLFFAASGYSKQAVAYAKYMGIALYTYEPTGKITAVYEPGERPKSTMPAWMKSEDVWVLGSVVLATVCALGFEDPQFQWTPEIAGRGVLLEGCHHVQDASVVHT